MAKQTRAFEAKPNADGNTNAVASDLESYRQWRHPNGNFVVIGTGQDLDSKLPNDLPRTPPGWSDANPFDTDDDVATAVAESEAALANHSFGNHELTFQEVYEHQELSVRSSEGYEVLGAKVGSDSASYRETSKDTWTQKFSYDVPEQYNGSLRFQFNLETVNEGYAHARILRDGDEVFKVNTDNTEGIEYEHVVENLPEGEATTFNVEIRAVDPSTDGSNGTKARITGTEASPQFYHDGEAYWLSEVSRVALPTTEFKEKVGL